ncbi:MAG: hypothetical protein LBM93_10060 [Oscillospiraceae bacterium]|jgi:biopolymer transport protein ExbD|nr:hypothetical protein [Oscillospiraceae bacterium]
MFNLEVEHPVIYEIVQFFKTILGLGIIVMLIILAIFEIKSPKTTFSEHKILSFSDKENEDFIIGITADGKQFLLYIEKDGGLVLKKYDTDKTTIFKPLSENEKPYVKVKSNKLSGVKNVEIYISDNAIYNNKIMDMTF